MAGLTTTQTFSDGDTVTAAKLNNIVGNASIDADAVTTAKILDANVTTFIAGIVLFQFGTGAIKGFAVTLCIGIMTTLFTAVIGTRVGFDYFYGRKRVQLKRKYG